MSMKINDKEAMLCLMPKPQQSIFVYHIQSKENFFFTEKQSFLRKRGSIGLNKKRKEGFSTALTTAIKMDPQRR